MTAARSERKVVAWVMERRRGGAAMEAKGHDYGIVGDRRRAVIAAWQETAALQAQDRYLPSF